MNTAADHAATEHTALTGSAPPPERGVLFVCNQNAVRSPMAEGLADASARLHGRQGLKIASVGLAPGFLDGFSVAAMAEMGLDIADHKPEPITAVCLADYDVVIALTSAANAYLRERYPELADRLHYWPVEDPAAGEGNRDQRLAGYRTVRDSLKSRINALIAGTAPHSG